MTPHVSVQSYTSLDFNSLLTIFSDLDLGAPGSLEVNTDMSPWLRLPSVPQNLRVGGNLDKFVIIKFRNLHAGQVDDKLACTEPSTLLGMQAYGIETIFPLPRNLAHFLILVFLRKTTKFLKRSQNSFSPQDSKLWLYEFLDVFTDTPKHTSSYSQPIQSRRALQSTFLKWCTFWFPNSGGGKSTKVLFCF